MVLASESGSQPSTERRQEGNAGEPSVEPRSAGRVMLLRRTVVSRSVRLVGVRLLQAIPVIIAVTFLTFALLNLLPGGTARALAGDAATPHEIHLLQIRLHLNEPFFTRYWNWLSSTATGHLGDSLAGGQPISAILGARLPVTLELLALAFLLAVGLSLPVAVLAARKPHGLVDRAAMLVSAIGLAAPVFVFGIVLALIFGQELRLLPPEGYAALKTGLWANLRTMILPSVTLGFGLFAGYTRVLRADLLDQMDGADYIMTARAKGAPPLRVLLRHALRNSVFNFITLIGLNLGVLIGGTVVVEQVFGVPGVGQELIQSISVEDVTVVQAIVVVLALAVVASSLVTDLLYALLDPRIRHGRTSN